jgi:hypothetical protein
MANSLNAVEPAAQVTLRGVPVPLESDVGREFVIACMTLRQSARAIG